MTPQQRDAYMVFADRSKIKIAQARLIDKNNNALLFPEERRHLYLSPYLTEIATPDHLKLICGENCPFDYNEYRKINEERILIVSSSMTLKSNKQITLKEGLYFFEELILEENSILNTDGPVSIYVKKLELEKNAKLMGGLSTDYHKASPNDLIILAECWLGTTCSLVDHGIHIGSGAKVCGHIFAPDLKVILCKGYMGKATRVYGSILAHQFVTSDCGAAASYGPIRIIYEKYLDCACELRLETD